MGLLDFLGKIAKGEPVFRVQPDVSSDDASPTKISPTGKVIPVVIVQRVESQLDSSGRNIDCWVQFHNEGIVPVFLDKISLFGTTRELDRIIQAGEMYECEVYRGLAPANDNYKTAELYYRDNTTGDYFAARYMLHYDLEANGIYRLDEMRIERPVRDI